MKKFLLLAGMSAFIFACNDTTTSTNVENDSTDHAAASENRVGDRYTESDGDVSYRNGKVVVWRNGEWVESNEDVTLDNGVVVRRTGRVERNGEVVELEDGEVVTRTGRFFDKAGNAIEDAWDATKKGARKAGDAIEKGANKVGDEVKDVFDNDKDNKKN